jgi:hypothetical protein
MAKDRNCQPRSRQLSVEDLPESIVTNSPSATRLDLTPSSAVSTSDSQQPSLSLKSPIVRADSRNFRVLSENVITELIRQLPTLSGTEALLLSKMIANQLCRWSYPDLELKFRRSKITEKLSRASITVIDFECRSQAESGDVGRELSVHRYSSSVVVSDIVNPERPDEQLSCLWAPAYDGREGSTFSKEVEHIISVFKQSTGEGFQDKLAYTMAKMTINDMYRHYFDEWSPRYISCASAIQRACAWGIVAAKSKEVEYRLFAAALRCFINLQTGGQFGAEKQEGCIMESGDSLNNMCFVLTPFMDLCHRRIGTSSLTLVLIKRNW